jgi:hypothetical protein
VLAGGEGVVGVLTVVARLVRGFHFTLGGVMA